jgi:hypothetical protein
VIYLPITTADQTGDQAISYLGLLRRLRYFEAEERNALALSWRVSRIIAASDVSEPACRRGLST